MLAPSCMNQRVCVRAYVRVYVSLCTLAFIISPCLFFFWQSVLSQFLGPSKSLDRHLDADEALALGSALFAANLSDGFKLNRRIGMLVGLPFAVSYRVTPGPPTATASEAPRSREGEGEGEGNVEENLFPPWKKMPIKVSTVRRRRAHAHVRGSGSAVTEAVRASL